MGWRGGGLPPEGLAECCRRWFPADVRIPARGHHLPRGVDQNQPCEGPSGAPAAVAGAQGIRQHRRRSLWFRVSFQLLPQGGRLRDRLQGAAAACEEGFELLPLGLGDLAGLLEVVEHQGALELLQRHPLVGEQGHQPHPEEGEGEATGDRELGGIPPQPIQPGRRGHGWAAAGGPRECSPDPCRRWPPRGQLREVGALFRVRQSSQGIKWLGPAHLNRKEAGAAVLPWFKLAPWKLAGKAGPRMRQPETGPLRMPIPPWRSAPGWLWCAPS